MHTMTSTSVWLVGAGGMALDYLKVLRALDCRITVIGRGEESARKFEAQSDHSVVSGGLETFLASRPSAADAATHRDTLSDHEIDVVAAQLNVKREEVIEMETRMSGGDVLLDPAPSDDGEVAYGPIAYLADAHHEPTAMIEAHQRDMMASDGIATALASLDERSRRIVEERWLKVNDDGSGGLTLHDLADEFGVSAERIRQIEVAAMKKMKAALTEYAEA